MVLDYVVEHTSPGALRHTALDALASRLEVVGSIKHFVDPPAVEAMLRGFGFQKIVDQVPEERSSSGRHLVSAVT